ncbi:thioredoxin family protein [Pedobacter sp. PLR]|uniref:TlpA family protein disulfide reductase n=1 Tax=Pedobacter sp. PLR TaxID=2994465 RepID=UPI002245847B|nr:thioredoxin family protein [Pedobacter sp. PLR]MCX2454174.1 thioredoxin family protein [Pedobacter sp. PLR]
MRHSASFRTTLIRLATYLFLIFPALLKAQSKTTPKRFVTIDLVVQDSTMLKDFYIQFEMCKNDVNTNYTLEKDIYTFKIINKETRITVPISTKINYGKIKRYHDNGITKEKLMENGAPIYIFEQGDHIKLYITKKTLAFEGKKAEKYNCIQSINSSPRFDRSQYISFETQKKYEEMFGEWKKQQDSAFNAKKDILKRYKPKLSPEIYNLILADCQGYYYARLLGQLNNNFNTDEKRKKTSFKTYNKWFESMDLLDLDEKALVKSYRFCDFLFHKESFEASFIARHNSGQKKIPYTFQQIYNSIQKNHAGIIRDKVTLLAFYYAIVHKNGKSYLDTAHKSMGNNIFKTSIANLINNYSGSIYEYELFDQYGKLRKLSEFKDKLIVLDFWFTGCLGCISLAKELKPIMRSYQGNKDVEFISISIDPKKEMWLKSVNDETYSHKDQVNLYTNGQSSQHPIIKNYSLSGYPTLFLISKKGKIITTAMPRPIQGRPETVENFKNMIDKNL